MTVDVNPIDVLNDLRSNVGWLDTLTKRLAEATDELDQAEADFDELYDKVAEALRDEYHEAGRRSDPAEHTILSETRRQHRAAYTRLRRAKHALERLEKQSQNVRAAVTGRTSLNATLRDEARAGG